MDKTFLKLLKMAECLIQVHSKKINIFNAVYCRSWSTSRALNLNLNFWIKGSSSIVVSTPIALDLNN